MRTRPGVNLIWGRESGSTRLVAEALVADVEIAAISALQEIPGMRSAWRWKLSRRSGTWEYLTASIPWATIARFEPAILARAPPFEVAGAGARTFEEASSRGCGRSWGGGVELPRIAQEAELQRMSGRIAGLLRRYAGPQTAFAELRTANAGRAKDGETPRFSFGKT